MRPVLPVVVTSTVLVRLRLKTNCRPPAELPYCTPDQLINGSASIAHTVDQCPTVRVMCVCLVSSVVTCRTIIQFKAMYDDRKRDMVSDTYSLLIMVFWLRPCLLC